MSFSICFSLTYFTQHNTLQVHPCCCKWQNSILLYVRQRSFPLLSPSCRSWMTFNKCSLPRSPVHGILQARTLEWLWVKGAQSCPTLCDSMDYTVRGILQARILEWVAIPFSRGSSWPRDRTQVFCIAGRFFAIWATREAGFLQYPIHSSLLLRT